MKTHLCKFSENNKTKCNTDGYKNGHYCFYHKFIKIFFKTRYIGNFNNDLTLQFVTSQERMNDFKNFTGYNSIYTSYSEAFPGGDANEFKFNKSSNVIVFLTTQTAILSVCVLIPNQRKRLIELYSLFTVRDPDLHISLQRKHTGKDLLNLLLTSLNDNCTIWLGIDPVNPMFKYVAFLYSHMGFSKPIIAYDSPLETITKFRGGFISLIYDKNKLGNAECVYKKINNLFLTIR